MERPGGKFPLLLEKKEVSQKGGFLRKKMKNFSESLSMQANW